mgnify:CR=1 FL=1
MSKQKFYVIDYDGRAETDDVQLSERGELVVTKISDQEKLEIERRERMAMDLIASLISQKKLDSAYGDTTIVLSWREGGLNKIDITDHVSYK